MILFSLLSCGSPERIYDPTSHSTLSVPPGWRVDDTKPSALFLIATDEPPDGASCNLMVSAFPSWAGFTDAERRRALETDDLAATPGVTILDQRWVQVSGHDAQRLLMDFDQVRPEGTARVRTLQVRIPRDQELVQLTCTGHRSTFDLRRPTFDTIIDHWEVR